MVQIGALQFKIIQKNFKNGQKCFKFVEKMSKMVQNCLKLIKTIKICQKKIAYTY